jgi:threonine dehydrogenase-like Zn-dependent dehydrogenase
VPVDGSRADPVEQIRRLTKGRGVDVALEVIGRPETMSQAVRCLAVMGRAVIVGIADERLSIDTYRELLGNEVELIGSNDHLLQELPGLLEMARRGILDTSRVVTRTIPLEAKSINDTLDALERWDAGVRTVVVP